MRKVTNIISPLLKKYRYRNKPDPFVLFNSLRKNEKLPSKNKEKNVLILPIRVAPVSNLFEGVYGHALNLRGYNVHGLFCNQFLKKCDNVTRKKNFSFNCSLCHYEQKRFIKTFSIISHDYQELMDKNTVDKVLSIANKTSHKDIFTLVYDGMLLGNHIKGAVMRHLLVSEIDIEKHEDLVREYTFSTISSYECTKRLITILKPKFVLSSHGVYSTWGGALEACRKLNVEVVVWARGYVSGNIIASRNQSYLYERVIEPLSNFDNIILTDKQKQKTLNYFTAKKKPDSSVDHVNYYANLKSSDCTLNVSRILGLSKEKMRFGLFPNIPWDGTTFSSSEAFPSMQFFFQVTFNWFKQNPGFDLIVRAHPAELKNKGMETIKDLIDKVCPVLPSNIYYLDASHVVSSYDVAEVCDACLLYASTMALELAYFGKTVIQAGQSNASNKKIIFEPKSVNEYELLLHAVSHRKLKMTEEMKERAQKYAYHWIYKRHIPENTYEHKALTFTKYNLTSSMDLMPGKNKVVDWFLNECERGGNFIWENNA